MEPVAISFLRMALLHSRIGRVFFSCPNTSSGGLYKIHTVKRLNHHFQVFRCTPACTGGKVQKIHKTGAMCLNVRVWGNARRCHTAMGLSSDVFSSSLSMCWYGAVALSVCAMVGVGDLCVQSITSTRTTVTNLQISSQEPSCTVLT